jgi:hypothetical protein
MSGGSGTFDSAVGYTSGVRDFQTGFSFDKKLYFEMRNRLTFANYARSGEEVDESFVGKPGEAIQSTTIVRRVPITSGDEIRFTMDEAAVGMSTWGPKQHPNGDFSQYKNIVARLNTINGPAFPIESEEDQQRIKDSITNIPRNVQNKATVHMAQEIDASFYYAVLHGASPNVLGAKADGGLGHSLGVNAGGGAGFPLMNKWWYCGDGGWVSFSTTPATYNGNVNTAINAISTTSEHKLTLAQLKIIRAKLDTIHFWPVRYNGKEYKALCLLDTELFWRLNNLLATQYTYARERSKDNPIFNGTEPIELDNVLYVNDPNLGLFRPAYNSSTPTYGPTFGPNATSDHRTYTNSSAYALAIFLGAQALIEGYNESMKMFWEKGRFEKSLEVAARQKTGVVRAEWYAKDGRTDAAAVQNYNCVCAAFYEPGVGSSYA